MFHYLHQTLQPNWQPTAEPLAASPSNNQNHQPNNYQGNITTIPANFGFADHLAEYLVQSYYPALPNPNDPTAIAQYEKQLIEFSRITIYLPTNRSRPVFAESFVKAANQHHQINQMILPRLLTLSEPAEIALTQDDNDNETIGDNPAMMDNLTPDPTTPPNPYANHRVISSAERLTILTRFINEFYHAAGGFNRHLSAAHALRLAKNLAKLLDQLIIQQIPLKDFLETPDLASYDLGNISRSLELHHSIAEHWVKIKKFLQIITEHYPQYLAEKNLIDHQTYVNGLLQTKSEFYLNHRITTPVLVVGTTGSRPSTRALIKSILTQPNGMLVLPNFDKDMDESLWRLLKTHSEQKLKRQLHANNRNISAIIHPQKPMVDLLVALGIQHPTAVKELTNHSPNPAINHDLIKHRQLLLRQIFISPTIEQTNPLTTDQTTENPNPTNPVTTAPTNNPTPATTPALSHALTSALTHALTHAMSAVTMLNLPNMEQEAKTITLIIQQQLLQNPKAKLQVVTMDRQLIRRLVALLTDLGLTIEPSVGRELALTPGGSLLLDSAEFWANPNLQQLALLLQNPALQLPFPPDQLVTRQHQELLHFILLNNILPNLSYPLNPEQIQETCNKWQEQQNQLIKNSPIKKPTAKNPSTNNQSNTAPTEPESSPINAAVMHAALQPIVTATTSAKQKTASSKKQLIEEFLQFFQTISPIEIWQQPFGKTLLEKLAPYQQLDETGLTPKSAQIKRTEFAEWLREHLRNVTVHTTPNSDPRIKILGPMESRLQQADTTILAGLAEGIWPPQPAPDPWLSYPLRQELQLPDPLELIAQSAHNFATNFLSSQLFLTTRQKEAGIWLEPSRWWKRLHALLQQHNIDQTEKTAYWQRALSLTEQYPNYPTQPQPNPKPALTYRPSQLSVTALEKFFENPFWLYARHILKLKKPEILKTELLPNDFGSMLHKILEQFIKQQTEPIGSEKNHQLLLTIMQQALITHQTQIPTPQNYFLHYRLQQIIEWFWQQYQTLPIKKTFAEITGKKIYPLPHANNQTTHKSFFTLTAKADRLDARQHGAWYLIDYKTGQIPNNQMRQTAQSLQLLLEANIAAAGGFALTNEIDQTALTTAASQGKLTLEIWHLKQKNSAIVPFINKSKTNSDEITELQNLMQLADTKLETFLKNLTNVDLGFGATADMEYNDYELFARQKEWDTGLTALLKTTETEE